MDVMLGCFVGKTMREVKSETTPSGRNKLKKSTAKKFTRKEVECYDKFNSFECKVCRVDG